MAWKGGDAVFWLKSTVNLHPILAPSDEKPLKEGRVQMWSLAEGVVPVEDAGGACGGCLWRMLGMRTAARYWEDCGLPFSPSCEHCLAAVLLSAVNPSLALEQGGRHGTEQDFGRQMYHAVTSGLWVTLSVGPSWRGCNPQMVVRGFLHSSKPCGQSTLFILSSPHPLILPVCQGNLKYDADHLSPGITQQALQPPTTHPR